MLTSFLKKLTGGKFLFLIIGVCLSLCVKVNGQEIEWQNTIGGSLGDGLLSICQTTDGGFICGGISESNTSGDKTENCQGLWDYWVVKLDSMGQVEWENTIGGDMWDELRVVVQTSDGGFLCGGFSNSGISGDKTDSCIGNSSQYDFWLVKLNSVGSILWQKTVGGNDDDRLLTLNATIDNGFICGGISNSGISGNKNEVSVGLFDYWILKLDSIGNIEWQNTIGGNYEDWIYSITQTSDGGYICSGTSRSDSTGDKTEIRYGYNDFWILKLDTIGNIEWQNTIGGNSVEEIGSIIETMDGGFIVGGASMSGISVDKSEACYGHQDCWLIKLDLLGNIQWERTYGGAYPDGIYSVAQTTNGEFLCGGTSQSFISGNKTEDQFGMVDCWVLKFDSLGNLLWQNNLGGNFSDQISMISNTFDNGLIVGASSASDFSGDKSQNSKGGSDLWIIKLTDHYNLITGTTFLDLNSNSALDVGEPAIPNKTITETNTNRFAFTQQNGFYSVSVLDTVNFSVSPAPLNYYTAVPANHSASFTGIQQTDSLNDFAFQPIGTFNDLCVTLTPLGAFRPGFDASYMINYENVGTTTLSPTVTLYQSNLLSYVSSTVGPTATSTDSVQWSGLPVLSPFQSGSILVTLNVSASAVIGSNIYSQCIIEPIANDYNVYCNYAGATSVVTGSVDPNDILVSEDTLTTTQLATQPFLDYTIRFQNTGNDTAFTVKIINPIDTTKLELSSIEFVNSTHPVQLKWVNYNRNMEFLFENILLPDSNINEPQSHGFVTYRIKPKTTLLAGDSVTNKAYIYFDFNAPVETNTAVTKIVLPTSINELVKSSGQLALFPNPAKDELNIQINNSRANNLITVSIFDVLGNTVLSKQPATANCKLPTAHFSKGIYFVEVKTGKEVYRAKFVKE